MLLKPRQECVQRRAERLSPIGEPIFDFRGHLMVDESTDDSMLFQLAQLLNQHLLRNRRDRPFQVGKAQHLAAEQMEQDDELPPAVENLERALDALGSRYRRVCRKLTSW